MASQDRYLTLEVVLTFGLWLISFFLLSGILSGYWLLAMLAITAGFVFSYTNKLSPRITRVIVTFSAAMAFAWAINQVLNSSFFYKEFILTWIKGIIVFTVVLSFNAFYPQVLAYIQILNIPIFMSLSLYNNMHSIPTICCMLGYIFIWAAILKLKLYQLVLSPATSRRLGREFSLIFPGLCLVVILSISWFLFSRYTLLKFRKVGVLPEITQETEDTLEPLEKVFFYLQDQIQDKTTRLMPLIKPNQKRNDMFTLVKSLIEDTPDTIKIDKAREGLISLLKQPGLGLQKDEFPELGALINNYVDKKVQLNQKRHKDKISQELKQRPFNIIDRIAISFGVSNLLNSGSLADMRKDTDRVKKHIKQSSFERKIKDQVLESLARLKDLQVYGLYLRKKKSIENKLSTFNVEETRQKISNLVAGIGQLEDIRNARKIENYIQQLKNSLFPNQNSLLQDIRAAFDLRLEMLLTQNKEEIVKQAEDKSPRVNAQQILLGLSDLEDAVSSKDFQQRLLQVEADIRDEGLEAKRQLQKLLETKIFQLQREILENVGSLLGENIPEDLKHSLLKGLKELELQRNIAKLDFQTKRLGKQINKLSNMGFIPTEGKETLEKDVVGFSNLCVQKLKIKQRKILDGTQQVPSDRAYASEKKGPVVSKVIDLFQIKITPESLNIPLGDTGELSAVGIYVDGAQKDLTLEGRWLSSDLNIARVVKGKVRSVSRGVATVEMGYAGIRSRPVEIIILEPKLISILVSPQEAVVAIDKTLRLKAEGYFSDSSHQDITSLVKWDISNPSLLNIETAKVIPRRFGKTDVFARYQKVKSLPIHIKVTVTLGWILGIILRIVSVFSLLCLLLFVFFYVLTKRQEQRLLSLIDNHSEFVIDLYTNALKVLSSMGLKYRKVIPALAYAQTVEKKFSIDDYVFLQLTEKFEEAKYSKHNYTLQETFKFLDNYNDFLSASVADYKKYQLYLLYGRLILRNVPWKITLPEGKVT